jgi:hypothetical protein
LVNVSAYLILSLLASLFFFFFLQPAMKEEDVTDSDIFAHTSGVNTFKCNYSIQSWI